MSLIGFTCLYLLEEFGRVGPEFYVLCWDKIYSDLRVNTINV